MKNDLILSMIQYYTGDPKRIQHFMKVHSFAKLIGEMEQLDQNVLNILEIAAIVHDIGIKIAEEKFGNCNGKLQEQEGPALAESLLTNLGYDQDIISRVSYLVGHHHTYDAVDGMDYQILIEADFIVNMYEDQINSKALNTAYNKIFKTESGKKVCKEIFSINL